MRATSWHVVCVVMHWFAPVPLHSARWRSPARDMRLCSCFCQADTGRKGMYLLMSCMCCFLSAHCFQCCMLVLLVPLVTVPLRST